ncbi:hypothetical protein C1H46_019357 [Malus baccata]|uniref:Aminotransferase-like plant mobile domain-containing protein n=1 Tax=Malus baccata TaxID=106549 RepID=A0A540M8Z1_MALBA|nr:hypothetical protein C1H46_019357 [Malus baccata]
MSNAFWDLKLRQRSPLANKRLKNPKAERKNKFVDKYFSEMTRIGRREIAQVIQVAFDTGTTKGDQDATCLIILYLFNTNMLGSLAGKLPWSLAKNCNSNDNINQYNWANEITKYLMKSIDRTQKRKIYKQPTVSGAVVLLLYWICDHTTIINPIEGKDKRSPTTVKWDLANIHEKIYKEANENLEMDNAKKIEESVEQRLEDDDDNFVNPSLASKKRKMEKQVAKKGPKAKKAKA